ncbi:AAA family ATPase [Nocardia amamiensis]|uniref:AAA family ATPase n=2 Tax=Nocardia amamiensis TaxID=404578 RepID=A0ABS0D1D2_9NOCA|nr:AAA family ATPase [Nocardia amamiensis]
MHEPGAGRVGGLPAPTQNFVGRSRELEELNDLLLSTRLITLTGPGGIGKTRLAAEAIRRVKANNSGVRVHWVRLARLPAGSDHAAVERETTRVVIEADFSQRSGWEALLDTLTRVDDAGHPPRTIVVFDNCEHVLDPLLQFVTDLLDAVPDLTVLTTSRTHLGWIDEHVKNVPPLTKEQALALFQQRVELTGHEVTGEDEVQIAAEICRHVHHHPLYIQLAAARRRYQSLAGIRDELSGRADDQRMHWSTGPRSGVDPRHRRVTHVIRWSYELCSDQERLLFDRLSVFAAGYDTNPDDNAASTAAAEVGADLAAIQAVCGDDADDCDDSQARTALPRAEIQHVLERLVDQSLVTVHITTSTVRYSLLESLRMFAWQQLCGRTSDGVDQSVCLAHRHLRYYRDRVTDAAARWFSPDERDLVDWARASWDNILTAIETSLTSPSTAEAGLEICMGLIALRVPFVRGRMQDIRRWTERCLAATEAATPQPTALQVAARSTTAWMAVRQGQSDDANRMLEDCVAAFFPDADRAGWRDKPETDFGFPPQLELAIGTEKFMHNRDPRAVTVLERARDKFHDLGNPGGEMMAGMFAGFAAGLLGSPQQAHEISERCLEHARASDAEWAASWAELSRAVVLIEHGDPKEALDLLRHAMSHQLLVRDQWGAAWAVELWIWALAALITTHSSDHHRNRAAAVKIAYLVGGVSAVRARLGVDIASMGTFADQSRRAAAVARKELGSAAYTAAEKRGAQLSSAGNEVHRLALGELIMDSAPPPAPETPWHTLSKPQLEIAILVAAGYTNRAIAELRGVSRRTIDAQVAAIFSKLRISSRRDVVAKIPAHHMPEVEAAARKRPELPT